MRTSRFTLAAALAVSIAACGQPSQRGRITVLLKDAPAPVEKAVVTITQVSLQGEGGAVVLSDRTVTTDLITLANDVDTLVDGLEIPAGTYSQLRFQMSGGYLEVGGKLYASSPDYAGLPAGAVVDGELRMPSYGTSGLKVILPDGGLVVGPGTTTVLVDFDVARSFGHVAGNSGAWVMHPVVKGTVIDGEQPTTLDVALALGESVHLPEGTTLAAFFAVLTPKGGGTDVIVPLVSPDGGITFGARFVFLTAGDHVVTFKGPAGFVFTTDPAVPYDVTLVAEQQRSLAFTLLTFGPTPPPTNL
jgi:hypothetical protein